MLSMIDHATECRGLYEARGLKSLEVNPKVMDKGRGLYEARGLKSDILADEKVGGDSRGLYEARGLKSKWK